MLSLTTANFGPVEYASNALQLVFTFDVKPVLLPRLIALWQGGDNATVCAANAAWLLAAGSNGIVGMYLIGTLQYDIRGLYQYFSIDKVDPPFVFNSSSCGGSSPGPSASPVFAAASASSAPLTLSVAGAVRLVGASLAFDGGPALAIQSCVATLAAAIAAALTTNVAAALTNGFTSALPTAMPSAAGLQVVV